MAGKDAEDLTPPEGWGALDLTPPEGWRVLELKEHTPHLHRIGPIFYRRDEQGQQEFACRAQPWSLNNAGNIHGGVLMSLADFSACSVAMRDMEDIVATISFSAEFLQPGPAGSLLVCRVEQLRSTDNFSFLRGQVMNRHRVVLNFSATVKRVRRRSNMRTGGGPNQSSNRPAGAAEKTSGEKTKP